jgi:hypothetical protein
MADLKTSLKHVQIDKANSTMVLAVAIAGFVVVFAGFMLKELYTQRSFQNRVISSKETTKEQLEENVEAAKLLNTSYTGFVSTQENIIGGSAEGDGPNDGDNARIVLDALPSKYDFPALATSLEKLITDESLQIESITGTDDELSQLGISIDDSASSQQLDDTPNTEARGPAEMPFGFEVRGDYDQVQSLIDVLERSIRPFHVQSMMISGEEGALTLDLDAKTYFQPERIFGLEYEAIR